MEQSRGSGQAPMPVPARTPLGLVLALDASGLGHWRLQGPRLQREWRVDSTVDFPTGPVHGAWWDLQWRAGHDGEEPLTVCSLYVDGTDPLGPIAKVDWGWTRAAAVVAASRLLAGIQEGG